MKKSIWLENYEQEVQAKKDKSGQNKKGILIIIPLLLVFLIMAAMASGGMADSQAQSGMLFTVGIFVFIMIFAII